MSTKNPRQRNHESEAKSGADNRLRDELYMLP